MTERMINPEQKGQVYLDTLASQIRAGSRRTHFESHKYPSITLIENRYSLLNKPDNFQKVEFTVWYREGQHGARWISYRMYDVEEKEPHYEGIIDPLNRLDDGLEGESPYWHQVHYKDLDEAKRDLGYSYMPYGIPNGMRWDNDARGKIAEDLMSLGFKQPEE